MLLGYPITQSPFSAIMRSMSRLLIFVFIFILIIVIFGTAALAGFLAAPFVPTKKRDIKRMLELAELGSNQFLYDLGCGDGRIVIAAARDFKAKAVGIEFSVLPYLFSKIRVRLSGLQKRIAIQYGDFFKVNLKKADVVVCFLTPMAMRKLSPKFKKELKKGARVVSYVFPMKDWTPLSVHKPQKGDIAVYLYQN